MTERSARESPAGATEGTEGGAGSGLAGESQLDAGGSARFIVVAGGKAGAAADPGNAANVPADACPGGGSL